MNNPYSTPSSELQNPSAELELAGRGIRLGAAVIDSLIAMAILVPAVVFFGLMGEGGKMSIGTNVSLMIVSFVIFLALHGYFLKTSGQTIGKKIVGIQIVGLDNQLRPLPDLLLKRYLPLYAVGVIPVVGSFLPLVDVLFIFREDRRCVHDLIAGTKVVSC